MPNDDSDTTGDFASQVKKEIESNTETPNPSEHVWRQGIRKGTHAWFPIWPVNLDGMIQIDEFITFQTISFRLFLLSLRSSPSPFLVSSTPMKLNKNNENITIDNDGTIFQMLDTQHKAWHAGIPNYEGGNPKGIGVEISNAYYLKYQDWYVKNGFGERPVQEH